VSRSTLLELGINVTLIAVWSGAILVLVPPVIGFILCRKLIRTVRRKR